jgi:hypothetical protein
LTEERKPQQVVRLVESLRIDPYHDLDLLVAVVHGVGHRAVDGRAQGEPHLGHG